MKQFKIFLSLITVVLFMFSCTEPTDNSTDEPKKKAVESVELSVTTLTVAPFATSSTIKATVTPADAENAEVTWTSSNEAVATVKNGKVTGVSYGEATITATAGEKTATCAVTVKDEAATAGDYETNFWDNASVYFVITDRFYNGNEANDTSYGREKGNPTIQDDCGKFFGGDIAGLTAKLDYLKDLGINAIWLTAPYEQIHGFSSGASGFKHYPYHGYYAMDYTNMDANMGTKAEFKTFVETAHAKGIRVVLDVVMNHPGYNTVEDAKHLYPGILTASFNDSVEITAKNFHDYIDYKNCGTNGWDDWWGGNWIRAGLCSHYKTGSGDLKGSCGGSLPDFITESDEPVSLPVFLKKKHTPEMAEFYPTEGYDVVKFEEIANYSVRDYLIYWLSSWVREFGIDGFRCDTAKHVEKSTWKELKDACVDAYAEWKSNNSTDPIAMENLDFWMTGEHWGHGVEKDAYFTDGGFDSMINFKFRAAVKSALSEVNKIDATYKSYVEKINNDKEFNVLSYISSHDTGSDDGKGIFYSGHINGDKQAGMITAGSLFAMCPGAIQIYYGDEAGREDANINTGDDKDQKNRSQMPWAEGEAGYNADLAYKFNNAIYSHWSKMLNFRANHVAVGAGSHERISLAPYTFKRERGDDKIVVVMGAAAGEVTVDVSSIGAAKVKDFYTGTVVDVADGKATFTVTDASNGTLLIEAAE